MTEACPGLALAAGVPVDLTGTLGVAVSGGGDSMALLHLAVPLAASRGLRLAAVTVDHGLRDGSASEAAQVARVCESFGVPHQTLHWRWDGQGNLSDRARQGRYGLMADWARAGGLAAVALGHTQDDVAETFLMRLTRRAGLDGLARMRADWRFDGVRWLRPLLGVSRASLRDALRSQGAVWSEDPTNDDTTYLRVRARRTLGALAPLGIAAPDLAAVAEHLADARVALAACTADAARRMTTIEAGDVLIDRAELAGVHGEIRRRLLSGALTWIASAAYGPRADSLATIDRALASGRAVTLHGCRVTPSPTHLRLSREARAVAGVACPAGQVWDGRWQFFGPETGGLRLCMLGESGLALCREWRATGLPRASLIASPAVWQGDDLVAAPLAGWANGWQARIVGGEDAFPTFLLSH